MIISKLHRPCYVSLLKGVTSKSRGPLSRLLNWRSGLEEGLRREEEHEHYESTHWLLQLQEKWSGKDMVEEGEKARMTVYLHKFSSTRLVTKHPQKRYHDVHRITVPLNIENEITGRRSAD